MQYTASKMSHHIQTQREGQLSVAAYCQAHDLRPSTFYYWRKKLAGVTGSAADPMGFTQIKPVEEPHRRSLYLSSGLCVDLEGLSISELAELILAIDGAYA